MNKERTCLTHKIIIHVQGGGGLKLKVRWLVLRKTCHGKIGTGEGKMGELGEGRTGELGEVEMREV
jgi:hypothetical protein